PDSSDSSGAGVEPGAVELGVTGGDIEISISAPIQILGLDESEQPPAPIAPDPGLPGSLQVPVKVTPDTIGADLEDELYIKEQHKRKKKRASKTAYICPLEGCSTKVWAKPGVAVGCFCEDAGGQFVPAAES